MLGAIIGGALGLVGAGMSSSAAKSAAGTQAAAAGAATEAQMKMFEQSREDQAPWRQAGTWAVNKLAGGPSAGGYWTDPVYEEQITGYQPAETYFGDDPSLRGMALAMTEANRSKTGMMPIMGQVLKTPPQWVPQSGDREIGMIEQGPGQFVPEEDPGYRFGYEEFIEKPTLRTAAATGKLGSGATLKSLTRYASDYASTKYDNFLDRWYKSLDPYMRVAGLGSNVAVQGGNQAISTGQGIGQTNLLAGQAQAAGQLGSAYPYTQLANWGATNLMQYGMGNNTQQSPQPTNWDAWDGF